MSKAAKVKRDPNERKRKIGERQETIERVLTPAEMDDQHERLLSLLADKQKAEDDKKAAGVEFGAKVKRAQAEINGTLEMLRRKRAKEEITVEEWLTEGNEIVKINAATGERLGARNARADELQETLPLANPNAGETEAPAASDDAPPANVVAGDFGGGDSAQAH